MPPVIIRDPAHRTPVGMTVLDSDGSYTRMVVVNLPDATCAEFEVPNTGKTVADFNPEYDPEDPVVQTVYRHSLDKNIDDWMSLPLAELHGAANDAGLRTYSYPAQRLKSSFSHVPERVETHRELVCYQSARLTHLAATINHPDQFQDFLMWSNYKKRVEGDVTMSSILKENKYQMKENIGVCLYRGCEAETTFDHIIPMSNGGPNTMDNMVPVCRSCNSSKSDKNVVDWHQQHGMPIDRIVLGKYLKLRWKEFEEEGVLDAELTDSVRDRWEGVEISRNISQTLYTDARIKRQS